MKKILILALLLAGCAAAPEGIAPQQVSDLPYRSMSCGDARQELNRVNNRLAIITAAQESRAQSDAVMMGVGLLVFAPAVLFIGHGQDHADEIGRLRGEQNALNTRLARC